MTQGESNLGFQTQREQQLNKDDFDSFFIEQCESVASVRVFQHPGITSIYFIPPEYKNTTDN